MAQLSQKNSLWVPWLLEKHTTLSLTMEAMYLIGRVKATVSFHQEKIPISLASQILSLASTRYGDHFDGQTASLCVKKAMYFDPKTGKEDPAKKGICSNFLCDSTPGDKVQIVGPFGQKLILPNKNPIATHIMVATGTGIAPFRAHLKRMFMENTTSSFQTHNLAWLFTGVATIDNLLYHDEFLKYMKEYPTKFWYNIALSREQINPCGGKLYVQDIMEEHSKCVLNLLDNGAHIYFCGLKEMMPCIQSMLKRVVESQGESWEMKQAALMKNKQWHVDVY